MRDQVCLTPTLVPLWNALQVGQGTMARWLVSITLVLMVVMALEPLVDAIPAPSGYFLGLGFRVSLLLLKPLSG
jgi:hypothetical protein